MQTLYFRFLIASIKMQYVFRFKNKGGQSDSQLIVIGALVSAIPWITHYAHVTEEDCVKAAVEIVKLTHPEKSLVPYIEIYATLLYRVLNGKRLTDEAQSLLSHPKLGGSSKKRIVEALLEKAKKYEIYFMVDDAFK